MEGRKGEGVRKKRGEEREKERRKEERKGGREGGCSIVHVTCFMMLRIKHRASSMLDQHANAKPPCYLSVSLSRQVTSREQDQQPLSVTTVTRSQSVLVFIRLVSQMLVKLNKILGVGEKVSYVGIAFGCHHFLLENTLSLFRDT